jgi:hypothetical protein
VVAGKSVAACLCYADDMAVQLYIRVAETMMMVVPEWFG